MTDLADDLAQDPDHSSNGLVLVRERRAALGKNTLTFRKLSLRLDDTAYRTLASATADIVMNKMAGHLDVSVEQRTVGGMPVPVRITRREHYPPGATGENVEMDDEVALTIDPTADPPEREFTLTTFGLPEPVGVVWETPTPRYVWWLIAAAGFLVLAVGFRYLARRRARLDGGSSSPRSP
ncbi:MAG TPA: hypothetical protein VGF84_17360 [Micromonosporaceae bacterium]|jgi:hypothetical protein